MRDSLYLTMNQRGVVRMTKGRPSMKAGEIAVRVVLSVDDSNFRMPYAEASLEIDERHAIQPEVHIELQEEGEGDLG